MKNIREIVSNNIIMLRKQMGLTQIDLSKKINYSDKAISRWEKGEVTPDVETLEKLAKIFNVPTAYLIEEHDDKELDNKPVVNKADIFVNIMTVCIAWCILTVLFVYIQIIYNYSFWQAFVWGIPVTAVVIMYFNRKWKNNTVRVISRTLLNWSLITSVYLQFLHLNMWLIYIVGIPIQITIIVAGVAKSKRFNE